MNFLHSKYIFVKERIVSLSTSISSNFLVIEPNDHEKDSLYLKTFIMNFMARLHYKRIIILLALFGFLYFLFSFNVNNNNEYENNLIYSIVIDAGSTGSRIHVFKLNHDKNSPDKNFDIKLVKEELFLKVKPGLSSFFKEPHLASESIKPLLDKAVSIIPKEYHSLTRLSLKATAGLRMISDEIANKILRNIQNLFSLYPFKNTNDDVGILDGKFEGIYSWFTLNYALQSLGKGIESSTCSLDLGGGSTQVTFLTANDKSVKTLYSEHVTKFRLDQIDYEIYAKSFLGFGLMSARMNIFKFDILNFLKNSNNKSTELSSVCIPFDHKSKWFHQGVEYTIIGPENKAQHSYEKCLSNVVKTIENKINAPVELRYKEIYAFSFYYDRLKNAMMFKGNGGTIQIENILKKAISICNDPDAQENNEIDKFNPEYPFLCMDLTFIYSLLTKGFGLPNEKFIHIHNEVNKMEISWALGAAFHMVS